MKGEKCVQQIFDDENEGKVDVVVFAPKKAALTITKARMTDNHTGKNGTKTSEGDEDDDDEEETKNLDTASTEDTPVETGLSEVQKKLAERRKQLAERKARFKRKKRGVKEEETKEEVEEEEEIEVKNDFVASGSRDKLIKIWNANKGSCIMTLSGHDGWVKDLVFHTNGKFLLSVSDDHSIRVWDLRNNGI